MIPTLEWLPSGVNFLDQTKLPLEETYVLATDYKQVATVIRDMIVRGAPAIGVSAAMGMAIGIDRSKATNLDALTTEVAVIAKTLAETRQIGRASCREREDVEWSGGCVGTQG